MRSIWLYLSAGRLKAELQTRWRSKSLSLNQENANSAKNLIDRFALFVFFHLCFGCSPASSPLNLMPLRSLSP
jgi:hypothetical protein